MRLKQMHTVGWTDERVQRLRAMWSDGFSARLIAAALGEGVSRNAIIGKVHRLKLAKRVTFRRLPRSNVAVRTPRPQKPKPPRQKQERQPKPPEFKPEPFDAETDAGVDVTAMIGLMELTNHTCRWPVGMATGSAQMFCGKHTEAGSYCPEHAARAGYGYGKGARP